MAEKLVIERTDGRKETFNLQNFSAEEIQFYVIPKVFKIIKNMDRKHEIEIRREEISL